MSPDLETRSSDTGVCERPQPAGGAKSKPGELASNIETNYEQLPIRAVCAASMRGGRKTLTGSRHMGSAIGRSTRPLPKLHGLPAADETALASAKRDSIIDLSDLS